MRARIGRVFRRKSVRAAAAAIACLGGLGVVAASQAASDHPGVLGVRLGGNAVETRVVVDLGHSVTGKVVQTSDGRMAIALSGVKAGPERSGGGRGLVRGWSIADSGGAARLQLNLAADTVIKGRFLLPPADGVDYYRYVVDLKRGAAEAAPAAPVVHRVARRAKTVVVVDAGHGGRDPGALGARTQEKNLTLAAAKTLKAKLERTGRFKVVMTRDSDVYVPLETRVRIARRADADLFISLHADAGADTSVRGASVYTLSDQATSRSARFVNKDDWFMKASATSGEGVSDILLDLTQRMTRNRSGAFAEQLLEEISDETPLLRRSHRDAGYMVLLAPDVPAVLLEMGFITNRTDEAALASDKEREALMGGVARAIDDYFNNQIRLASR